MKRYFISAVAACVVSATVNAQIPMPQPSPTQTVRQDFGMGKIELTYSRPSVKGRTLFGNKTDLAPVGQMWRTGANSATKIRFTDNVIIGGKNIDSGTYSIFTIPQNGEWDVILNKNTSASVNDYKQAEDVVRLKAKTEKTGNKVETFTMQFSNLTNETADLELMWGSTLVRVPIAANFRDRLRGQIESALEGEKKPYFQAANYYYDYEKNYDKALQNVNSAIETNPKAFWMHMLKARILHASGDKAAAKTTAQHVVQLATDAKNDDYVRMANDFMKKM